MYANLAKIFPGWFAAKPGDSRFIRKSWQVWLYGQPDEGKSFCLSIEWLRKCWYHNERKHCRIEYILLVLEYCNEIKLCKLALILIRQKNFSALRENAVIFKNILNGALCWSLDLFTGLLVAIKSNNVWGFFCGFVRNWNSRARLTKYRIAHWLARNSLWQRVAKELSAIRESL